MRAIFIIFLGIILGCIVSTVPHETVEGLRARVIHALGAVTPTPALPYATPTPTPGWRMTPNDQNPLNKGNYNRVDSWHNYPR